VTTVKLLGIAVLTLVVGYLLGGWALRSDIYALEEKIAHLEQKFDKRAYDGNPSLSGITQMLNVPEKPSQHSSEIEEQSPAEPAGAEVVNEEKEPSPTEKEDEESDRSKEEPETFEERIEQAADLWGMRSDLARDAFLTNINATEEEAGRFDVLVEAMNIRLETTIEKWAETLAEDSIPSREAGLRMMNEITEALVLTYDELNRSMPQGWSDDAGSEFQLVDYIDPLVAMPLSGLDDKLQFD
jgi:hypothetical protein